MGQVTENKAFLYEFGEFVLDPNERVFLADGVPVHLTDKIFDTLLLLVRHNGQLVTKEQMMTSIWNESFVEESNLTKNISRLRKILNNNGSSPIETLPKHGYRFRADVREIDGTTNLLVRRMMRLKVSQALDEPQPTTPSGLPLLNEVHSLAVMPFQPLDTRFEDDIFGLGMTDALITQFSRAGQIQVRPTRSILKYSRSEDDAVAFGRELQVDAILEGSFQRLEDQVRLTVQMVHTANGDLLWSEIFIAEVKDIFTVQDQIADRVVGALTKKLSDEAEVRLKKRYTENIQAYQEYLSGRLFLNKRTANGYDQAIKCFERAIEIDPSYALAYAGLADVYNLLPNYDGFAPHDYFPKAKAAALKALEIDENLAEAHAALGLAMLHYDWNWNGAEVSYRHALKLNPNYSSAYELLGVYLCRVDRVGEAITALKKAQELDPSSPINATWLAEVLRYCGETEAAIRLHQVTLESFRDFYLAHYHLAVALLDLGRLDEAVEHCEKAISLSGENSLTLSLRGVLSVALGDEAAVRETLNKLLSKKKQQYISSTNIASIYAAAGDEENALEWLETAQKERDPNLTWIRFDKEFHFLKKDPRFQDLLHRVGFAQSKMETVPFPSHTLRNWLIGATATLVIGLAIYYFIPRPPMTGGMTRLTNNLAEDESPEWSPDGKKIAFVSNRDGQKNIYVMNADGSNVVRLTDGSAAEDVPVWSPDGTKILFGSMRDGNLEIYIMYADGTDQTRLTFNSVVDGGPARFSPDGKKIVFSRSAANEGDAYYNFDIYTMNVDGSDVRQLTTDPEYDAGPYWSPDSSKITFLSARGGNYDVFLMNVDGTDQVNLTKDKENESPNGWTADGKQIFYNVPPFSQGGSNQLGLMNSDGSNRRQITSFTEKSYHISYSPVTKKLTFGLTKDGNFEIYTMDASTLMNN